MTGRGQSKKQEREEAAVAWRAEEERIKGLEHAFAALPDGPEKLTLEEVMTNRVIELYNAAQFDVGDAILEFLPRGLAMRLLNWYFDDENAGTTFPPEAAAGDHEATQSRQVQSEPQA